MEVLIYDNYVCHVCKQDSLQAFMCLRRESLCKHHSSNIVSSFSEYELNHARWNKNKKINTIREILYNFFTSVMHKHVMHVYNRRTTKWDIMAYVYTPTEVKVLN